MNLGQYNNRHVIKHVTLKSIFYIEYYMTQSSSVNYKVRLKSYVQYVVAWEKLEKKYI